MCRASSRASVVVEQRWYLLVEAYLGRGHSFVEVVLVSGGLPSSRVEAYLGGLASSRATVLVVSRMHHSTCD